MGEPEGQALGSIVSCLKTLYGFCFLLYVYVGSDIKFLKFIYCSNDFSPPDKAHYDSPLAHLFTSSLPPLEVSPCTVAWF